MALVERVELSLKESEVAGGGVREAGFSVPWKDQLALFLEMTERYSALINAASTNGVSCTVPTGKARSARFVSEMERMSTMAGLEYLKTTVSEFDRIRDCLITVNRGLVCGVFQRHFSGYRSKKDALESAGTLGLIGAIDGFDPLRGCVLSTYADKPIKQKMVGWLRSCEARGAGITVSFEEQHEITLARKMPSPRVRAEIADELASVRAKVNKALSRWEDLRSKLPADITKDLLTGVLGLDGGMPAPLEEVAQRLDITPKRARRILGIALTRIGYSDVDRHRFE